MDSERFWGPLSVPLGGPAPTAGLEGCGRERSGIGDMVRVDGTLHCCAAARSAPDGRSPSSVGRLPDWPPEPASSGVWEPVALTTSTATLVRFGEGEGAVRSLPLLGLGLLCLALFAGQSAG